MDRRKKVINFSERHTKRLLEAATNAHGWQVYTKLRVADALDIERSGLDADHYRYALSSHLDFVVADADDVVKFAVEYDGPYHDTDPRAAARDRKKNLICEKLDLPLARVRDEQTFRARGIDYLTWLAEVYCSWEACQAAWEDGSVPLDEPLDPTMFITLPTRRGSKYPLWLSLDARIRLRQFEKEGVLGSSSPTCFSGYREDGRTGHLSIIETWWGDYLVSEAAIYMQGFGVAPSEVAEEIAIVNLAKLAERAELQNTATFHTAAQVRELLVNFLRTHRLVLSSGCISAPLGFGLRYVQSNGKQEWIVGALADQPELRIS